MVENLGLKIEDDGKGKYMSFEAAITHRGFDLVWGYGEDENEALEGLGNEIEELVKLLNLMSRNIQRKIQEASND